MIDALVDWRMRLFIEHSRLRISGTSIELGSFGLVVSNGRCSVVSGWIELVGSCALGGLNYLKTNESGSD